MLTHEFDAGNSTFTPGGEGSNRLAMTQDSLPSLQ